MKSLDIRYWTKTFQVRPLCCNNFSGRIHLDGNDYEVCTWQTHGGEEYDRLRPLSYPQTDVFLICFSVTCPSAFQSVRTNWYPELEHHAPGTPKLLVGTMSDLRENVKTIASLAENRTQPISYDEGVAMAKSLGIERYIECSALTGENVDKVFEDAIRMAAEYQLRKSSDRRGCFIM
ncbi:P-loop containing nucleoside triphosphate hydrolase protein [Flagelloscypha sp. PMI_526]|nr:P-loop containing nucleoside triphosphate hydrolase protein [Flagelloscypha sp. PMI_526]